MPAFTVDDRSSSIQYSGTWVSGGTGGLSNEFQGTAHSLQTITSDAGAQVVFTGTSIEVYGTVGNTNQYSGAPPASTYNVDGTGTDVYVPTPGSSAQFRQRFYQSPELPNGVHTLIMKVSPGGGAFSLDYLLLRQPDETISVPSAIPSTETTKVSTTSSSTSSSVASVTPVTQSSSSTSQISQGSSLIIPSSQPPVEPSTVSTISSATATSDTHTITSFTTPTNSTTPQPISPPKDSRKVIIGAAVGCASLVLAIIILVCIYRRRRAAAAGFTPFSKGAGGDAAVKPQDLDLSGQPEDFRSAVVQPEQMVTRVDQDYPDESPPSYYSRLYQPGPRPTLTP